MKSYLRPIETPFSVDFFDELPLWSAPFGWKLLDKIEYRSDITALDIGFGTGFPMIELAMRLGDGSKVFGIDPWAEASARAKQKIEYCGLTHVQIIEGAAESIPLSDNTVDLIVSNNGINNVRDPEQVFAECARIASPAAQFVISMNLDESMVEFYGQLEEVLAEARLYESITKMHEHIYHKRRPLSEVLAYLEKYMFNVREVMHEEFKYRFTDATAMFNHAFIRRAFLPSWQDLIPADQQEAIFDRVEQRLNLWAQRDGQMQLSVPFVVIDAVKK
jgi:ubiquinone/menaquinone biosynthesis C-methylase UbiE